MSRFNHRDSTTIHMLVASDLEGGIGFKGTNPWSFLSGRTYASTSTESKPIVFGRKTAAALYEPLPRRINFVMTQHKANVPKGFYHLLDLEELLNHEFVYILGGAQIFRLFLPYTTRIERLLIHPPMNTERCDTFFPDIPKSWYKTRDASYRTRHLNNNLLTVSQTFENPNPLDLSFLVNLNKENS